VLIMVFAHIPLLLGICIITGSWTLAVPIHSAPALEGAGSGRFTKSINVVVTPTGIPGSAPLPIECKLCDGARIDAKYLRVEPEEDEAEGD